MITITAHTHQPRVGVIVFTLVFIHAITLDGTSPATHQVEAFISTFTRIALFFYQLWMPLINPTCPCFCKALQYLRESFYCISLQSLIVHTQASTPSIVYYSIARIALVFYLGSLYTSSYPSHGLFTHSSQESCL